MLPLPRLSTGLHPRAARQPSFYGTACLFSTFSHNCQSAPIPTLSLFHSFVLNIDVIRNYVMRPT